MLFGILTKWHWLCNNPLAHFVFQAVYPSLCARC